MSLILDALRRRSTAHDDDDPSSQTARTDRVLATLGYRQSGGSGGPTPKALFVYAGLAVALGFVGLWVIIAMFSPAAPDRPAVQRTASSQPPLVPGPPAAIAQPPAAGATRPASPAPAPAPANVPAERPAPRRPAAPVTPAPAPPAAAASAPRPAVPPPSTTESPQSEAPAVAAAPAAVPAGPPTDHFGLALYYQRVGDFDNALVHYRVLLEQNDSSSEVHNNVGLVYRERGRLDEAITEFQRAIEIDPKYVRAHNNLGVALMGLTGSSRLDAAAAEFRVALAADPRNVESIVNLALVQRAAGRGAAARDLLLRAVGIDARSPGAHYNLAVVADESGEVGMAVEHYRAFLRLGAVTHADLAARVRTRLQALGSG